MGHFFMMRGKLGYRYNFAQAGKHFDPTIVDIFLKISDIIED